MYNTISNANAAAHKEKSTANTSKLKLGNKKRHRSKNAQDVWAAEPSNRESINGKVTEKVSPGDTRANVGVRSNIKAKEWSKVPAEEKARWVDEAKKVNEETRKATEALGVVSMDEIYE